MVFMQRLPVPSVFTPRQPSMVSKTFWRGVLTGASLASGFGVFPYQSCTEARTKKLSSHQR